MTLPDFGARSEAEHRACLFAYWWMVQEGRMQMLPDPNPFPRIRLFRRSTR